MSPEITSHEPTAVDRDPNDQEIAEEGRYNYTLHYTWSDRSYEYGR